MVFETINTKNSYSHKWFLEKFKPVSDKSNIHVKEMLGSLKLNSHSETKSWIKKTFILFQGGLSRCSYIWVPQVQ